ncbi:MAG: hypothetical protein K0M70_12130, partial [Arenimonas sp.]|uniref:hypothetical protein n=1 Tax=Arenimonas sp. TaxID=1872635 RepID=UPI0025B7CE0E
PAPPPPPPPPKEFAMTHARKTAGGLFLLATAFFPACVSAYTVGINSGTRAVYLRVGTGGMSGGGGRYSAGGTPTNVTTVNTVSVTLNANAVGTGVPQAMSGNGNLVSQLDNFAFCNAGQVYIGAFMRLPADAAAATATVRANYAANLTNAAGDTIAMSQISWTSSGNGDGPGQPFASGSFTGTGQAVASFGRNSWNESCFSFSYANADVVGAGTYTNRVTYTITAP